MANIMLLCVIISLAKLHQVAPAAKSRFQRNFAKESLRDSERDTGRVVAVDDELAFVPGNSGPIPEGATLVALGAYIDSAFTGSNFGKLRIVAQDESVSAVLRYRGAGFLEGYLTAPRIWDHFRNTRDYFQNELYPDDDFWGEPIDWLKAQDSWVREQVLVHASPTSARVARPTPGKDQAQDDQLSLWGAVQLLLAQFDGLVEGYAARCRADAGSTHGSNKKELSCELLTREQHMFLQNNGELYDVIDGWVAGAWGNHGSSTQPEHENSRRRGTDPQAWRTRWVQPRGSAGQWLNDVAFRGRERCSALIKVTADISDLFIGHSTFDSFTQMTRIYKHYELGSPGFGSLSFSSYPGETFSDDDFYLSQSGLVVVETTNHVFDPSIYSSLTPESLLSWQRVRGALMTAATGENWVRAFNTLNSGTYNNQYMVVDLKRFSPKKELAPGLFWVVEQLPGMVMAVDATDVLSRGYWGSYNVPYFDRIYNASGYPAVGAAIHKEQAAQQGVHARRHYDIPIRWLRYQVAPRAMIFRRDQGNVENLSGMQDMMRYNNYKEDALSGGQPLASVCGRADLADEKDRLPKGCYDSKVTSYKLALKLQAMVIGGPTTSHGLPPFDWSSFKDRSHYGMPHTFDFEWERMAAEELEL